MLKRGRRTRFGQPIHRGRRPNRNSFSSASKWARIMLVGTLLVGISAAWYVNQLEGAIMQETREGVCSKGEGFTDFLRPGERRVYSSGLHELPGNEVVIEGGTIRGRDFQGEFDPKQLDENGKTIIFTTPSGRESWTAWYQLGEDGIRNTAIVYECMSIGGGVENGE
jgi:hypothetical protein